MQGVSYNYRMDGSLEKVFVTLYVDKQPKIEVTFDIDRGVESVTIEAKEFRKP